MAIAVVTFNGRFHRLLDGRSFGISDRHVAEGPGHKRYAPLVELTSLEKNARLPAYLACMVVAAIRETAEGRRWRTASNMETDELINAVRESLLQGGTWADVVKRAYKAQAEWGSIARYPEITAFPEAPVHFYNNSVLTDIVLIIRDGKDMNAGRRLAAVCMGTTVILEITPRLVEFVRAQLPDRRFEKEGFRNVVMTWRLGDERAVDVRRKKGEECGMDYDETTLTFGPGPDSIIAAHYAAPFTFERYPSYRMNPLSGLPAGEAMDWEEEGARIANDPGKGCLYVIRRKGDYAHRIWNMVTELDYSSSKVMMAEDAGE